MPLAQRRRRPQERHCLGEIADVIIAHFKQRLICSLANQRADQPCLGVGEREPARHRRQRIAAIRIIGMAEVIGEDAQLGIAPVFERKTIQQMRETIHVCASATASSSSP